MRKISSLSTVSSFMVLAFIVPQIAFAAWWNPFSWNFFGLFRGNAKTEAVVVSPVASTTATATTTDTSEMVLCNGQYWKKCLDGQSLVCPTDTSDAYCSIPKTPKTKESGLVPSQSITTTIKAPQASLPSAVKPTQSYKLQAIAILQGAKDNYSHLLNYDSQGKAIESYRRSYIQGLRNQVSRYATSAPTAFWQRAFSDLADSFQGELNGLAAYMTYFEISTPNYIQSNIDKLNAAISSIQNSNTPVTYDQMTSYQVTYFGTNKFENDRDSITSEITQLQNYISNNDASYKSTIAQLSAEADRQTGLSSVSVPQFVSATYVIPQTPQTTHCTVMGDQRVAEVNCTSY